MTTWVLGDIHGCAQELERLLEELALSESDHVVSVGDLFHRGPDPVGVMDLLEGCRATFLLGNHENAVLARFGLDPKTASAEDRPAAREDFPALSEADLAGDGSMPCEVAEERRTDILRFLQRHAGFFLEHTNVDGAGPTRDGRPWCVVHAGLVPGQNPTTLRPDQLIRLRRLAGRGRPFWYEVYTGPNLVLFGHTPSPIPRAHRHGGKLVALGLDTGCVYGGKLTAYSPEEDEFRQVRAKRAYFER
ncbi:MAG: metallophosphoesterase [Planctomycetota bacterium]|nr:metallophosphoesterase [Planctomycetota bacterium]